ncbi:hypothetical protein OXX79_010199 [Metschnikowia pulcherrima]
MLSNDLLSYSIMQNGEKAVAHALPHYAPLANTKLQAVSLPPITSYVSLTENNLNSFNSYLHRESIGGSTPPSLTSSSSASESPLASPRMANISLSSSHKAEISHASAHSNSVSGASPQRKRRQRLGPSCDSCRARKVKCNADVVMISRNFTGEAEHVTQGEIEDIDEYTSLSPAQKEHVLKGEPVHIESNYVLVLSNRKLIKYKPCMSCAGKGFACCFSNGFTKEDIVHSKRHGDSSTLSADRIATGPQKVSKKPLSESVSFSVQGSLSTRKSSCGACRKRKVKCIVNAANAANAANGKCVGCTKKDIMCTF